MLCASCFSGFLDLDAAAKLTDAPGGIKRWCRAIRAAVILLASRQYLRSCSFCGRYLEVEPVGIVSGWGNSEAVSIGKLGALDE